jgi:hypothetical protein
VRYDGPALDAPHISRGLRPLDQSREIRDVLRRQLALKKPLPAKQPDTAKTGFTPGEAGPV